MVRETAQKIVKILNSKNIWLTPDKISARNLKSEKKILLFVWL